MKRIIVIGILAVLILNFSGFISTTAIENSTDVLEKNANERVSGMKGLTAHTPIYIYQGADFSDADDDGVSNPGAAGSPSDPYIIENWDIDASTAYGIHIENTNIYFIIRNCVIHDGKNNVYKGIYFYNVKNGKIDNVTTYNNDCGIYLSSYSNNNQITNCSIYDGGDGIYLIYTSNNNQITNCQIHNNSYGIELYWYSSNNQITNCNIYNNNLNGIQQSDSSNSQITNCAVYNNSGNGIRLDYGSNNQITNCYVYNNSGNGIFLWSATTTIIANQIYNNCHGISVGASGTEIHYNNIYNNRYYGVYSSSYTNDATYNWWGSDDGPSGVGPGNGDNVSSNVLYDPWIKKTEADAFRIILVSNAYYYYNHYANVNQSMCFNASSSYAYCRMITQYCFDFGDGNTTGWVDSPIVNHSYSTPGQYSTKLKVKNDWDWISYWSDPLKTAVFTNIPPFAILQQLSSNYTYANISISGYSSFDFDGNVTQYYFDFGDNNTGWVSIPNITRQYPDSGYYTVRLKVKDNEDCESNWTNITFYVWNRPPTAIISANPVVVEIGLPITFDASESDDLDGNVIEYYFDFGDGTNSSWTTDYSKSHLYITSGVYNATLRVKDDDGSVSSIAYIMVIVGQPSTPDNQLPVVDAGSNVKVYVGEPVLFNGTATDSDGYIIYYQWDFDGDGIHDWNSTNTGYTTYAYAMDGKYYAEFRVYDNQGGVSTGTRTITVKKGYAQTVTPSGGTVEYNNTIIIVPEGAITQNVTFTVTKITLEQPSGYILIGDVCRIETNITMFTQSITLILSYNESDLPTNVSEDGLAIYKKVENDWIKLDSAVDKVNNTVSTLVTSLSEFAILYKLPEAEIESTGIQPVIHIYLIIVVIITILIIAVGVMVRKRKTAVTEVEVPHTQISMLTFRCPQCKTTFQVESKERLFKIKCPSCGYERTVL